jgi:hypothetical protein
MTNKQLSTLDHSAYLAQRGYQVTTALPAAGQPTMLSLAHWLARHPSKVLPAVTATVVFALARWTHADLVTSTSDLAMMIALTALTAGAGVVSAAKQNGDSGLTSIAFALSGGLATFTVAAHTASTPLALVLVLLPLVIAYAVGGRSWRDDKRTTAAYAHERHLVEVTAQRDVTVAALTAQAQQDAGRNALLLVEAVLHRSALPQDTAVPGEVPASSEPLALTAAPAGALDPVALLQSVLAPQASQEQVQAWTDARGRVR